MSSYSRQSLDNVLHGHAFGPLIFLPKSGKNNCSCFFIDFFQMWQFQIVKSSSHLKDLWVKRHSMQFLTWASLPWWKYSIRALYHCWKEGTLLFCKLLYCYSWHFTTPALISPRNDVWAHVQKFHTTQICRAVTKISSCRVYAVSRWGTEQPGSSFGLIFLLFPKKIAGGHAHSTQGKSLPDPWPLVTTLQIRVLLLIGRSKFSTNQKHYPDLGTDGSSVWTFYAHSSASLCGETSGGIIKCWLFS